jgi:hypothetical protein
MIEQQCGGGCEAAKTAVDDVSVHYVNQELRCIYCSDLLQVSRMLVDLSLTNHQPTLRAYALASFAVHPPAGSSPPSVMLSPMVRMVGRFQMVGSALPRYAPGAAAALLPLSGLGTTSEATPAAAAG